MDIQDIQDIYKKFILSILSIHVSQKKGIAFMNNPG